MSRAILIVVAGLTISFVLAIMLGKGYENLMFTEKNERP